MCISERRQKRKCEKIVITIKYIQIISNYRFVSVKNISLSESSRIIIRIFKSMYLEILPFNHTLLQNIFQY